MHISSSTPTVVSVFHGAIYSNILPRIIAHYDTLNEAQKAAAAKKYGPNVSQWEAEEEDAGQWEEGEEDAGQWEEEEEMMGIKMEENDIESDDEEWNENFSEPVVEESGAGEL